MCLLSALVHVLITNFVPGFGCGEKGPGNENENEKSEDYSKADLKQRVLFFITIFKHIAQIFEIWQSPVGHEEY